MRELSQPLDRRSRVFLSSNPRTCLRDHLPVAKDRAHFVRLLLCQEPSRLLPVPHLSVSVAQGCTDAPRIDAQLAGQYSWSYQFAHPPILAIRPGAARKMVTE